MSFRSPNVPRSLESPPRGKVLVIAPHPDDETMGVGGTLRLHSRQGDPISAVFICNGVQGDPDGYFDRAKLQALRESEARAAAVILGISELLFWGYPDNLSDADIHLFEGLPADPDAAREALSRGCAAKLAELLESGGYTICYYPWEGELNPDHWLVGQSVAQLRRTRGDLEGRISFLGYDVWTALPPDLVIDTSDVMPEKLDAVRCYRSQLVYVDYEHAVLGLDAYRSLLLERGATFGEAFVGRYHGLDR